MKLFDQQGKVFGKLNILDLLLIIVLIGALIFAGLKFVQMFGDGDSDEGSEVKTINYVVYNSNSHLFVIDNIQIGDELRLLNNNTEIGKVVDMKVGEAKHLATTAQGEMVESVVPNKQEVYLTVELEATIVDGVATVKGTKLLVGQSFSLQGPNYMIPVLISEVDIGDE